MEAAAAAVTPETARRTRAALAEIPTRLDLLRIAGSPMQPVTNVRDRSPAALPPGYLSPAQSPDELVISQRGRRRLPVTWSPDIELKRNSSFHSVIRTPPKASFSRFSPTKLGVTLRSTPRKRLLLGDTDRLPLTPEKIDFSDISTPEKFKISDPSKSSPIPAKKMKIEKVLETEYTGPIDLGLKGLSSLQLISMLKNIIVKHPEIEREVRRELPAPDLRPLEEKLNYLKCNIFKSLPTSRLISKTDSPAYSRVSTHLLTFKKCLTEQGKTLIESQHWGSVVDYVLMAWSYVRATPTWDNQAHNSQRNLCFKALTNFCMVALKKGGKVVGRAALLRLRERLPGLAADSDDALACLRHVDALLRQLQDD